MIRACVIAVVVLVFGSSRGTAQDKVKLPKGQAPRFFTVTKVANSEIELTEVSRDMEGLTRTSVYTPAVKDIESYDVKGKRLSTGDLFKRAKPGVVVLVAADENLVDPVYLSVLKDEVLILVGVVTRVELSPVKRTED